MNIKQAVQFTAGRLRNASDTAQLDAELLVGSSCNKTRAQLLAYPEIELSATQIALLDKNVERRVLGEPIAYILGHKEFWSLDFTVTRDTLIPRPETEHLLEWVLENFSKNSFLKVADLGTGAGAIAIALAHARPHWILHATDQSPAALDVATHNALKHQIHNIKFFLGHWCEALIEKNYDLIISNPPYIATADPHLEQLKFEPLIALQAGHDGLDAIRIIIRQTHNYLNPGGYLVLEHGMGQGQTILSLLAAANYFHYEDHLDLAGIDRFVSASKPESCSNYS